MRRRLIEAEYKRRVDAVLTTEAKADLLWANTAGDLTNAQKSAAVTGWQWQKAMKAAGRTIYQNDLDLHDDANWPAVPQSFVDLLEQI